MNEFNTRNYYGSRDLIRERMPIERNMNVMIETYGQILEAIQRNCKLKNFRKSFWSPSQGIFKLMSIISGSSLTSLY